MICGGLVHQMLQDVIMDMIRWHQIFTAWFAQIAMSASAVGTIGTAYALRDEDGRRDLACVKVPTVIIHGDKDEVVSNELAEYQYNSICTSSFYNLDNSGHGIMYDELETFNRIFLRAI